MAMGYLTAYIAVRKSLDLALLRKSHILVTYTPDNSTARPASGIRVHL
jgi:hypothetical protein